MEITIEQYEAMVPLYVLKHPGGEIRSYTPTAATKWRYDGFFEHEPETVKWISGLSPDEVFYDVGAKGIPIYKMKYDWKLANCLPVPGYPCGPRIDWRKRVERACPCRRRSGIKDMNTPVSVTLRLAPGPVQGRAWAEGNAGPEAPKGVGV